MRLRCSALDILGTLMSQDIPLILAGSLRSCRNLRHLDVLGVILRLIPCVCFKLYLHLRRVVSAEASTL